MANLKCFRIRYLLEHVWQLITFAGKANWLHVLSVKVILYVHLTKSRTVKAGLKCIFLIYIKITVGKFTKNVIKSELPNILLIRKALAN